jgi:hypothetical protein
MVEDQFCTFYASSAETLPVEAGTIVKIVGMTTDGRAIVDVVSDAQNDTAFGWLMQKVKATSAEMPPGFLFRGDLGSSDAHLGDPVGVAHGAGAIYETNQYVDNGADGITAGTTLYVDDDGKLEDTNADSGAAAAVAMQTLTAAEAAAGKMLRVKALF